MASIFDAFRSGPPVDKSAIEVMRKQREIEAQLQAQYEQMMQRQLMSGGLGGSYGNLLGGNYGNRQANSPLYSGAGQASSADLARAYAVASPAPGRAEQSRACPHEGIRAGEIIAYRSWKVAEGELRSTYTGFKWMPGQLECVGGRKKLDEGYGFFAYRDEGRARSEAMNEMMTITFAVGSIYLWGEIVEHETGYRATHAAIRSIDFVNPLNDSLLERLRKNYVVQPKLMDDVA